MCTHNLDEAERHCDRVAIFSQRLLAVDTPVALREKLFGRKVVFHLASLSPEIRLAVENVPGVRAVEEVENKLVVSLEEPEKLNPVITRTLIDAQADILFIGEIKQSLERVYLEMIRSNENAQRQERRQA